MKCIWFLIVFICIQSTVFAKEQMSLATYDWHPYVGKNLAENGFVAEIVREAFGRVDYEISLEFLPPKRAQINTMTGKKPAIFPFLTTGGEVDNSYLLSSPFSGSALAFYVRSNQKTV